MCIHTMNQHHVWPHYPLLLSENSSISSGPLPIGVPFHFSSDLFTGQCLVRIKNVKSDNQSADSAYFNGRKRTMQVIVQGRFKENVNVAHVLTGHEFIRYDDWIKWTPLDSLCVLELMLFLYFRRPFVRLPPKLFVNAFSNLIRKFSPGTDISIYNEKPYILAPLAAIMQNIAIHRPGEEPLMTSLLDVDEDTTLFGGCFNAGHGSMNPSRRKRYFDDIQSARRHTFDTSHVYTFDFYQDLLDLPTYSLKLGFTSVPLARYLDGQPIQVMCKAKDGRYLWNFQLWHECLVH